MEFAIDVEGGHVFLDVEGVGHVGSIEDEVEFEGPGRGPVLLAGDNEFLGSHLLGVGFLARAVGEGVDFGAKGFRPENTEMAKATTIDFD